MAYPASEMIANTIAEAINTASQMNAWDYISVGGVVTAGIGGVATAGLLFWEISKSRKERARIRSLAILQKIEKQHQKIISFLFKDSLPNNNLLFWNQAYLEILKLISISLIETKEIKEEAKTARQAFIETLKSIESSDPQKESLRWQFFTGTNNWQENDQTWEEVNKTTPIGIAFLQADRFGNFNKSDNLKNLDPNVVIAIYSYMYTEQCPELGNINLPSRINNDQVNNKSDIKSILKVENKTPSWLGQSNVANGLMHYLFEFYCTNPNRTPPDKQD